MSALKTSLECVRRAPRVSTRIAIVLDGARTAPIAVLTDLSSSGMFVEVMTDPPAVGSVVIFEFLLDKKEVRGMGKVVRTQTKTVHTPDLRSGIGIEFLAMRDRTTVLQQFRNSGPGLSRPDWGRRRFLRAVGWLIRRGSFVFELDRTSKEVR